MQKVSITIDSTTEHIIASELGIFEDAIEFVALGGRRYVVLGKKMDVLTRLHEDAIYRPIVYQIISENIGRRDDRTTLQTVNDIKKARIVASYVGAR